MSSPLRGVSVSETGYGCLERPPVSTKDSDREGGLGLAWRPTGPDTNPHIIPAPIYVGGGGVRQTNCTTASPAARSFGLSAFLYISLLFLSCLILFLIPSWFK